MDFRILFAKSSTARTWYLTYDSYLDSMGLYDRMFKAICALTNEREAIQQVLDGSEPMILNSYI